MDDKLSITILYCTAVFQSSTLLCLLLYIYVILDYVGRRDTNLPVHLLAALFLVSGSALRSSSRSKFRFRKRQIKDQPCNSFTLVIIIIIKKMTREEVVVVLPNKKKKKKLLLERRR